MTIDEETMGIIESNPGPCRPELLVAAVLHLMSHYIAHRPEAGGCLKLASVIERHLQALADRPDLAPVLRATCSTLSEQWAAVVDRTMPEPQKQGFFMRLVVGQHAA
jgi:hypothetical protein